MNTLSLYLAAAIVGWQWSPQNSGTAAGLRGLAVVSPHVVWASGTNGSVLRTIDGGNHWDTRKIAGAEQLDFRDVEAFDKNTAIAMSSGTGHTSRVYLTVNGGVDWTLVFTNPDASGFLDAMKFWDRRRGLLLGDPVGGRFSIFLTTNGGRTWTRALGPECQAGEGAFAASGTCLRTWGKNDAWFGSGGAGVARVFHTPDRGKTWQVAKTPLAGPTASSGIFSLLFISRLRGMAFGGDYQKPAETDQTVAFTEDGGKTWIGPPFALAFRSGTTYLKREKLTIAVGSGGSDYSKDAGASWTHLSDDVLNVVADKWAAGPRGLLVKLVPRP